MPWKKLLYCMIMVGVHTYSFAQNPFLKAVSLDGESQYIEIHDRDYLNYEQGRNLTIEFFFKPRRIKAASLLNKYQIGPVSYNSYYGQGLLINFCKSSDKIEGKIRYEYLDPLEGFLQSNYLSIVTSEFEEFDDGGMSLSRSYRGIFVSPLETGEWFHFAFVISSDGYEALYINGQINFSMGGTPDYCPSHGIPLCIGGYPADVDASLDSSYYFDGCIDEVRIWNTIRSQSEIQSFMNDTLGPTVYNSSSSGLVAYYRFDVLENLNIGGDGPANEVRDLSVNHNHAKVHGAPDLVDHTDLTPVAKKESEIPLSFSLCQNYPNPFNPETTINFVLPEPGPVLIKIYNTLGQVVETMSFSYMESGAHSIPWKGSHLSSGVYVCSIEFKGMTKTIKMMLKK